MKMNKNERILQYRKLGEKLSGISSKQIDEGVLAYCEIGNIEKLDDKEKTVLNVLKEAELQTDIETLVEFFESLLEQDTKEANGIVFTPKYIADYIVEQTLKSARKWSAEITVVDPGCGCGIFLVSAIEFIHRTFDVKIETIIRENIFGFDVEEKNVEHCKTILKIYAHQNGTEISNLENIKCLNSLKHDWKEVLKRNTINYVIGNPPYVNPHDLPKETTEFLKNTFRTTQIGTVNVFYAFIEHAINNLEEGGQLGYIVPNNFLTIKSACDLRGYIQERKLLRKVIDFKDNMVFKPVRTYSCILILSKECNDTFSYAVMKPAENIEQQLKEQTFEQMKIERLRKSGWNLVDGSTQENIDKIEGQFTSIKEFIKTGIATLRDGIYLVEKDEKGYYKVCAGKRIDIEPEIVRPIYKVSDLKMAKNLIEARKFIIFPYEQKNSGYSLIEEERLRKYCPGTYEYLLSQRAELDTRDNGKENPNGWYAYGRTQGLKVQGKKLLFPTFSSEPRFQYVQDENALFCNGYAISENEQYDLHFLEKILNSSIMNYYVRKTSYSIEGGYYCYQKKYIENFSIPFFSQNEVEMIERMNQKTANKFLEEKYQLKM